MVATRLMGYIKQMPIEEGEVVKKGELLFEVDPADIYSMLNQARVTIGTSSISIGFTSGGITPFGSLSIFCITLS